MIIDSLLAKAAPAGGAAIIPVKATKVEPTVTREFILDKENLLREQKKGVSSALVIGAYLLVLAIALGLVAALAWGLSRFARKEHTTA